MKRLFKFYLCIELTMLTLILLSVIISSDDQAEIKPKILEIDPILFITDSTIKSSDYILNKPYSLVVDDEGSIYVFDFGEMCIAKFDSQGKYLFKWGRKGVAPGEINASFESKLFFNTKKGYLYLTDTGNFRIQVFNKTGKYITSIKTERRPVSISVDSKGYIYVGMGSNNPHNFLVHVYDIKGKLINKYGKAIQYEGGEYVNNPLIVHDKNDNLHMIFQFYAVFRKYNHSGKLEFEKRLTKQLADIGYPQEIIKEWKMEPMKSSLSDGGYLVFASSFSMKNDVICLSFPVDFIELTRGGDIKVLYRYLRKGGQLIFPESTTV